MERDWPRMISLIGVGKRINYYRALGSRILPNLRGEIEERRDNSAGGNELRNGV